MSVLLGKLTPQMGKLSCEAPMPAIETRSNRSLGAPQNAGNLLIRKFLDILEENWHAEFGR